MTRKKPFSEIVFESHTATSENDFPSLSSPSLIIQTKKRVSDPKSTISNPSSSKEPSLGETTSSATSYLPAQSISQLLQDENQNAPPQSSQFLPFTDAQTSTSTEDDYITPAQRPQKSHKKMPTSFHLTTTYFDVLNGSLCEPMSTQLNTTKEKRTGSQREVPHNEVQGNNLSENGENNMLKQKLHRLVKIQIYKTSEA